MVYNTVVKRIKIRSPYQDIKSLMPTFYERIERQSRTNLVNIIIIDGKTQSGKSTLARHICEYYDKNYIRFYTIEDILNYLKDIAKKIMILNDDGSYSLNRDELDKVQNRWLLLEEPQLEASRQKYWSEKNFILTSITSSYGFLHNPLVMTLPNIKGLTDMVLTNVSLRITVKAFLDKANKIIRKAFIKIPDFNESKNKWYWTTVEHHTIPNIERDLNYETEKAHNFFINQLNKWNSSLKYGSEGKSDLDIFKQYLGIT